MTEKNPPIPRNSEYFFTKDGIDYVTKLPTLGGDPATMRIDQLPDRFRPWVAAMAIEGIRCEVIEAAHKEFPGGVIEMEDMAESEIGEFRRWETQKHRETFAWRAWGKR